MTCPACAGYGHAGYDRRGRPLPCRKCEGTGRITRLRRSTIWYDAPRVFQHWNPLTGDPLTSTDWSA